MAKRSLLEILSPRAPIAGMEIAENEIKFSVFRRGDFFSTSLSLPSGIIEKGKVKDKSKFSAILADLREKSGYKKKERVFAIISIPDSNVYTQVFNLPAMMNNQLNEAAKLNLQIISPIDFKNAYSDWQKVGDVKDDGGQIEVLGAFVQKQIIEDYSECLEKANFTIAAFEFPSLGVARIISSFLKETGRDNKTVLVLRINGSGLAFTVVRNGNLYFHHFEEWPAEQISLDNFRTAIIRETQKVLNFYASHWEERPDNVFVIGPSSPFEDLTLNAIKEGFAIDGEKIQNPKKVFDFPASAVAKIALLSADWVAVLGACVRGTVPRSKDTIISLASTGTEQEFFEQQVINFIKLWRNIILSVFAVIFISFVSLNLYLNKGVYNFKIRVANLTRLPESKEMSDLQAKATKFNLNIGLAIDAKNQTIDWASFLKKINGFFGNDIVIDHVAVQSADLPIMISARAKNEKAILEFKSLLSKQPEFSNIDLPISGIFQTFGDMLSFSVNFKFNALKTDQGGGIENVNLP